MRKRPSWIVSAATALLLAACGGGGSDQAQSAGPYAVSAALDHLLVTGGSWTMSGSANGQSFTLTMAFAPGPAGLFPVNGAFTAQSLQTITVVMAGQSNSGTQTIYFDAGTRTFIGLQADGTCALATANTALPATAAVGVSGPIFSQSDLDGCTSSSAAVGTTTNTWSVVSDTGIALLCWDLTAKDLSGTVNGTESMCIQTAADGTLGAKARLSITAPGLITISARNF
jgi:hypothetical protein